MMRNVSNKELKIWTVVSAAIIVVCGVIISVIPYTQNIRASSEANSSQQSDDNPLTFAAAQSGDSSGDTKQNTSSGTTSTKLGVDPIAPDRLMNTTLEVQEKCAGWAGPPLSDKQLNGQTLYSVDFTDGKFSGSYNAFITIDETFNAVFDGNPIIAVKFMCSGGGSSATSDIAVYDEDLQLIGFPDENYSVTANAERSDYWVKNIQLENDSLTLDVPVGVPGDQNCHACERTGIATINYAWRNSKLEWADTVFYVEDRAFRAPDIISVQQIIDEAVANKPMAYDYMTDEAISQLDQPIGINGDTVRNLQLADQEVKECVLVGPESSLGGLPSYTANGQFREFPNISESKPGNFVCGLTFGAPNLNTPNNPYQSYVQVTTDIDGTPTITDIGRAFG